MRIYSVRWLIEGNCLQFVTKSEKCVFRVEIDQFRDGNYVRGQQEGGIPPWKSRKGIFVASRNYLQCEGIDTISYLLWLLYPRWRPLLDGPLFGAFGPYGMDGSRTSRSEMSSRIAKWANGPEQGKLWQSRPVKGEVGIIYVPETQFFTYAQQGNTSYYAQSMQGAYQGFFDNNIQADWVHINHIDEYDFLYLPFPVMLTQVTAGKLRDWVDSGGTLVCEGCPGYFGDRGHVGTVQPNLGLDELFGVRESYVEFTPDLLNDLKLNLDGVPVWGGLFLQAYQPTSGKPVGWYEDGQVAAVDHTFGNGRTKLIGAMIGSARNRYAMGLSAIGGIEAALWDLKGKILETPVYQLLGVELNEEIAREHLMPGYGYFGE